MSTVNRKSARKYKAKKADITEKPLSRFQPGSGKHLRAKPTLKQKAEK